MTHEWVEQEKKRLAEKFENYPQRLLDEWYAILKSIGMFA